MKMLAGCRNALVNVEARPIEAQILTRRCIITKLRELTIEKFKEVINQNAGGLVVLLPQNFTHLSKEDRDVNVCEDKPLPFYFIYLLD